MASRVIRMMEVIRAVKRVSAPALFHARQRSELRPDREGRGRYLRSTIRCDCTPWAVSSRTKYVPLGRSSPLRVCS